MSVIEISKADKIRLLNDHLRTTFTGGRVMVTAHVSALEPKLKARVLSAARTFKAFDKDNDPHNEHDLATFTVDRESYMFKIDYYDKSMEHGSDCPADPEKTCRVITIMHASDY
jgi:hypothetical protein